MADISGKDLAYRALASALGGPVDLATMAMRPFGYAVEKPVLGSEWIGQRMEQGGLISEARDPLKEFAASVVVPSPGGLASAVGKGTALLPAVAGMTKVGKVEDVLAIPTGAAKALEEYVAGAATNWNTLLRHGTPLDQFGAKSQKMIQDLSAYLTTGSKTKGETLWRATGHEQADQLSKLNIGDVFVDKGFMSTSRSKDVVVNRIAPDMVEDWVDNVHLLKIKLPDGRLVSGKDVKGPTEHFSWQKEFLLDRDQRFRVVGKSEENGWPVTVLELLPK